MNSADAPNSRVHHFKLVLLGDTAVGKSCLVVRFVRDEFFEFQEPTIGAAFLTQTVALDDATVKFEIWCVACFNCCCLFICCDLNGTLGKPLHFLILSFLAY